MSIEQHPSKESFEVIWELICDTVEYRNKQHPEHVLSIRDNAKNEIWDQYEYFNESCKKLYMADNVSKLDRHKVCACYMFSILEAGLLDYTQSDGDEKYCFDEDIAISVGMSLLRAFIIEALNVSDKEESEKQVLRKRIEDGITFPKTNHGDYRENFMVELYYTKITGNYNILSLSNTLFLLERITLMETIIKRKSFLSTIISFICGKNS